MTQADVYKYLKKKKKWMTTGEIAKNFNVSKGNICQNLNKLYKSGDVERKETRVNNYMTYKWRLL